MVRCFGKLLAVLLVAGLAYSASWAAELATLSSANWDQLAPAGKEVDAIYGDFVLRSDRLVAVVAAPLPTRNANLTVKGVGGSLLDLTRRERQNDQLSCLYPHAGAYRFTDRVDWPTEFPQTLGAARIAFAAELQSAADRPEKKLRVVVGYALADGDDFLTICTRINNPTNKAISLALDDAVRADGEFEFGVHDGLNGWWCDDAYWQQAYGITPLGDWKISEGKGSGRRGRQIVYSRQDVGKLNIAAGKTVVFSRRIIPAANTLELDAIARELAGEELSQLDITVADPDGPVERAELTVRRGDEVIGTGLTDGNGRLRVKMAPATYTFSVTGQGRTSTTAVVDVDEGVNDLEISFTEAPGYVEARIVDDSGDGVPCKVSFKGDGVPDPNFGPDSAIHGVRNLWHTHDGQFRIAIAPGQYEIIISRGPEHDAVRKLIEVASGRVTTIDETLRRTVNTTGWISAELHSHSSPSGDNTSSQRGRVLNLLVDHLEFIPCTEHQRIASYDAHLEHFGAAHRVLTCTGMELTGSPLSINHQNVFPLIEKRHTQDGGAPTIHPNPEVQIERIAMWDNNSDKVVQINHPNIAQMVGDRDLDGEPDQGFRKMFHFADVMEVHPPQAIFDPLAVGEDGWEGRGNVIKNWMQLLNLGYRVPGVVNTDAHWNYHGSGWLRNFVRSSTDDPSKADLMEICHALERGQVVISNGPFMEVTASSGGETVGPGDDLVAKDGKVDLTIRVECPNWLDVNRVQVFVNGREAANHNYRRRTHGDMFSDATVKFERTVTVDLDTDAHLIVATGGEGRQLGAIYGEDAGQAMPVAVSNPVFVDLAGDGFTANGDTLGAPLPVERNHKPTHGHDHVHPHHHD